jgi:hypothetical protein
MGGQLRGNFQRFQGIPFVVPQSQIFDVNDVASFLNPERCPVFLSTPEIAAALEGIICFRTT